ncbi:Fibrinogen-like protein A,Ryncolin-4,Angiopoietin-related protein 1,Ficolin-2,Ryncolin-1,Tenascin-R,Fibrinogen-like protein 1,Ficolin-1,Tenascin-X,Ryncolin-3,Fibroleukin,Fibrinogen C domain-containing protein 1,Ryncolin-2,Angiopoietin-related protein 6,Techylectin-5B,Angiopoietin-related protein 2,Microfibril-associated glycoprotein 4,Fibrinogen alpha chain,Ficolin-1-A,Tenascin,Angiopoietin-4 [Mytilus coruscus]|uniref:Fibrinogen C-terminal domain-containing protein n=1 Tax=Mytilus coruscus TaxID=42192 RepID=A0A6J8C593_MYTCO|nr:Fibrinogen-like protein A,Ryncolin-4,Angiopoietin-related protein 1,Ficolin-2,Ryncolin-1,Tenascin-R,Fibrinogen-like protein 1,Ficolin-1,Tenascin-X,Ryncolin-3,Fibroleukin,Fibrinogen C domain-containing protein 1,Ryncolin-2,Angiopoietin-related protein 6,Techylectin-5B,Angiopoietin-related protein 2,Microfibril-associated glycoprotein 4,Fibrinogen alpha chain,Ficolin-1-A,Tenascin,Angiopoietin-4 [Mytilus coruscus]
MKDHTLSFVVLVLVVLTIPATSFAKSCNSSVCDSVKMPLISNNLKAPLVADLDVSALNAQLKDYIDDNIVSTFTEKIEDVVNKKLLELKNNMLNEYSLKLEKSHTRYDQELSEMHTEYNNLFSNLSENQSENVTKFMENVQEWQNTLMQSMNEQSGYFQKSKTLYENQVSEILRNYKDQTSQISKEAITNFTDFKTDMEEWKNDIVTDLIKEVTINITQFETHIIDEIRECSDRPKLVGVYRISPDDSHTFKVRCEAGGWTVIQKRFNGVTEFYRNWKDYEKGFGDLNQEFWLGNKYIALLTSRGNHELRIDLEDWNGEKKYALFKSFRVGDQSTNYRLTISGYSGNAGDSMTYHNNMPFSTYDRENDSSSLNCAAYSTLKGAWWYKACWRSSLNGKYAESSSKGGIKYMAWKRSRNLKKSSMMIKKT